MTLAQLLEEVMEAISLDPNAQRVTRAEAQRLINHAMREVSVKVGVPQLWLDVPRSGFVNGSFTLPTRVHPSGVKQVVLVELGEGSAHAGALEGRELDVLSVAEANRFHPRWDDPEREYLGKPFLVYSPATRDVGVRPVGIESARYRFLVHAVPGEMTLPEHEPFAVVYCDEEGNEERYPGALPEYHRLLAFHASYELLQRLGNPLWQPYLARYQQMLNEMFNAHTPASAYLPSAPRSWRPKRG